MNIKKIYMHTYTYFLFFFQMNTRIHTPACYWVIFTVTETGVFLTHFCRTRLLK